MLRFELPVIGLLASPDAQARPEPDPRPCTDSTAHAGSSRAQPAPRTPLACALRRAPIQGLTLGGAGLQSLEAFLRVSIVPAIEGAARHAVQIEGTLDAELAFLDEADRVGAGGGWPGLGPAD